MAEHSDAGSLPIQPILYGQASILDFLFFPGFTRVSTAYLAVDLNICVPLLCICGMLAFLCKHTCQYLWELLESYFSLGPSLRTSRETAFLTIGSFNYLCAIFQRSIRYAYYMGILSGILL